MLVWVGFWEEGASGSGAMSMRGHNLTAMETALGSSDG